MKTDEPKKDEDIDEDIPMEVDEDDDEPSVWRFQFHMVLRVESWSNCLIPDGPERLTMPSAP